MPILAKRGSEYIPAPAGVHAAVCLDVIDLGLQPDNFSDKLKHKIRMVWQIAETMEDGRPYQVSRLYNNSLYEGSSLRIDLESWRGRGFTTAELKGFDVETLIGIPTMLNVVHVDGANGVFANVASVMPLPKEMAAPEPRDYVRIKDRPEREQPKLKSSKVGPYTKRNSGSNPDGDVPF